MADEADSAAPAKDTEAALGKARLRTQGRAIARLNEEVDGLARFKPKPPIIERLEDETLRAYAAP